MRYRIRIVLRALLRRRQFEVGLAEELRFHQDEYAADLVRAGVPPAEAARRARLEFGNPDNVTADCRQARGLGLFDALEQDVRHALRLMRRAPAFTAAALGTLAVCLGANLAIFAVVDAVLLRPLPFPDADRLVRVFNTYPAAGVPDDGVSLTNYYERRGRIGAFDTLAIYGTDTALVGEPGSTERQEVMRVSPEFLATLGIEPRIGRGFAEAEAVPGADGVAIVSNEYWRAALGGDRNVVGRTVRVDGADRTIIGVLPPGFRFLSSAPRLLLPRALDPDRGTPDKRHWGSQAQMIARLGTGVTLRRAQAEVDAHNAAMEGNGPEAQRMAEAGFRSLLVPLRADHVAAVRPMLLLVQIGALFLFLIGAANLANLLLIRASGRGKEFAVRQAIGAGRQHVVREMLVETTVLTLTGGVLGLAVGAAGVRLLAWLGTDQLPLGATVAFDLRVAAVALLASVLAGLAVGAPIAWWVLRSHGAGALQAHTRGATAGRAARRMRHAFLISQIAVAFVLLSGAGLLGLSLRNAAALSPGFRPEAVVTARVPVPWRSYPDGASRLAFSERLLQALARHPGVTATGIATNVPLSGESVKSAATVARRGEEPEDAPHAIYSYGVGGDYFAAMGVPLREGRLLRPDDARRPARVCVVDEDFARRHWPEGGALGGRLFMGGRTLPEAEAFTIVGVVGAVKQSDLTDEARQGAVFYPYPYRDESAIYIVTRTALPAEVLASTLRAVVRSVDPELPVGDIRSMNGRIADSLIVRRSPALLAGLFAAVAVLLTAIGTYGVVSYTVSQRTREIGLRVALGARPGQVRAQFLWLAGRLVAAGTLAGLAGSLPTARVMQALLYQVPVVHGPILAGVALLVTAVCLAACLLPARRAARISPMEALAEE